MMNKHNLSIKISLTRLAQYSNPIWIPRSGCVWLYGTRVVWLDEETGHGYSEYEIFSQDPGYACHKKSGGQTHPPLHGMGLPRVTATINGCMQP